MQKVRVGRVDDRLLDDLARQGIGYSGYSQDDPEGPYVRVHYKKAGMVRALARWGFAARLWYRLRGR